jgi:hypothetical protein
MRVSVDCFACNKHYAPKLSLVEHDAGELQAEDITQVDAPDMTKYDLAQMQAEPRAKKHR